MIEEPKVWSYMEYKPEGNALSVAYSLDGNFIAIGTQSGQILIIDDSKLEVIQELLCGYPVHALTFSPNGKFLASSGLDGSLIIWSIENWSKFKTFGIDSEALIISWSSNNQFLTLGSNSSSDNRPFIDIWEINSWTKLKKEVKMPYYVAFSPDSKFLAIDYETTGIEILSVPDFKRIVLLDLSDTSEYIQNISSPAWSVDGQFLAACTDEGRVRIWRTSDWSIITTLELHRAWDEGEYRVAFSPDNRFLISGGVGHPKLLSIKTWKVVYEFEDVFSEDVLAFSWHPTSKYLAIVSGNYQPVTIWEITED
ncbi:MAG: hypothetical protein JXA54_14460 [Candidatus Heimdallarchaeota archaeon]|nr:hypothetical protein [Candidatus Heimdallarchaeota archaeon]